MNYGIDIIFKIAAIGIIVTVVCQLLKKSERDDIATLVSIAGLVIVLTLVISMIGELFTSLKDIFQLY
ncbi:MAG: stage III sporulation protein AC [Clostridia bacterium]|nr:stage III sporulation protein AC [Clostridia bacterium]